MRDFAGTSKAWNWLGVEMVTAAEGSVTLEMPTREEMANHAGVVHGGFISFLADSAMGRCLATVYPEGERHFSFDLKLTFLNPGRVGERLRGLAKVLHSGRRTGVAECQVVGEDGRLVATATASFIVYLPEE